MLSSASGLCQELPAYAHPECEEEMFVVLFGGGCSPSQHLVLGPSFQMCFTDWKGAAQTTLLLLHSCLRQLSLCFSGPRDNCLSPSRFLLAPLAFFPLSPLLSSCVPFSSLNRMPAKYPALSKFPELELHKKILSVM